MVYLMLKLNKQAFTEEARHWMMLNYENFIDELGELNLTEIVESAHHEFNPDYNGSDIDDSWFELAFDLSEILNI